MLKVYVAFAIVDYKIIKIGKSNSIKYLERKIKEFQLLHYCHCLITIPNGAKFYWNDGERTIIYGE